MSDQTTNLSGAELASKLNSEREICLCNAGIALNAFNFLKHKYSDYPFDLNLTETGGFFAGKQYSIAVCSLASEKTLEALATFYQLFCEDLATRAALLQVEIGELSNESNLETQQP